MLIRKLVSSYMRKNNYDGKFIVFEGLDGSGQSTQAELLKNYLIERGREVLLTKEPTRDSEFSKELRAALNKEVKIDEVRLQELFAKDRKWHLENVILPALEEGKFVICDRYFFSSFAYGAAEGLDFEWLVNLNDEFLLPDLTIILNASPEICVERIKSRGRKTTLFEEKEKLEKVWQIYQKFPERFENVMILDGERTILEIFEDIKKLVTDKL